jgi:putative phosphoesterase
MSMHRIGLVADTHIPEAAADLPISAYDALVGCERILHCGDLHTLDVVDRLERVAPTIVSRGNGDSIRPRVRRPGVPEDPRVVDLFVDDIGGVRIGMSHDLSHVELRSDDEAARLLERRFSTRVDIALYGHTHVPLVWGLADGTAVVNPGSPTALYGYRGILGTIGFIDIDDGRFDVTILDLATGEPQLRLAGPGPHPLVRGPRPSGGR